MSCVSQVWEAWWIKYMNHNLIYTMYAAHQVDSMLHHIKNKFNIRTPSPWITGRSASTTK